MRKVLVGRAAERELKRLDPDVQKRVIQAIRALAENPHPHGSRKLRGSSIDWRIRVGDYRILYEIDNSARTVTVTRIRHRREIYR